MDNSVYIAVTDVVYRFFAALDTRDHGSAASLISQDGVWIRQGVELVGPNAALDALERRPQNRMTCHLINNIQMAMLTDTKVKLDYYLTAYESSIDAQSNVSSPKLAGVLRCTDEIIMEGKDWKISNKTSTRHLPGAA